MAFEGHAGWLHTPLGLSHREVGVLIVTPPGRDGRCAYRPLRDLAEMLAAQGFPTLRFDLLGVGESLDVEAEADLWPLWLQGVTAAATALKSAARVERVVLAGLRLGATLAALADFEAEGLVLLAPVVSGRQWLRELKLASAMSNTGAPEGADAIEADGLRLSARTARSIATADLKRLVQVPARVFTAAPGASGAVLADRLIDLEAEVSAHPFPGYEMLLEDTHSNLAPLELFGQVVGWLDQAFPEAVTGEILRADLKGSPATLNPPGCVEQALTFGPGLSSVLCVPQGGAERRAVIFCDTAGEPKAGIGRFAVTAARELARRGYPSLRFDFAGIGDSEGVERGHMYETSRRADFAAAVDLLVQGHCEEIVVVGVCSGAHHALHALMADPRVTAAFVVSPKLVWRSGESLAPERRDIGRATGAYMQSLKDPKSWARLLRGGIDVKAVAGTLAKRISARLSARLKDEGGEALRRGMAEASARGAQARLYMGVDDASLDELETYFGSQGRRLTALPGMTVKVETSLDHGLSRQASRDLALAELTGFVASL